MTSRIKTRARKRSGDSGVDQKLTAHRAQGPAHSSHRGTQPDGAEPAHDTNSPRMTSTAAHQALIPIKLIVRWADAPAIACCRSPT